MIQEGRGGKPSLLLAEDHNSFRDSSGGMPLRFQIEKNKVKGFIAGGQYSFSKVE